MKSCFFIGHHDVDNVILPQLTAAVERHIIEFGVTDFYVGHYGNFDSMAARAVKDAKERHPEVTLTMLLPYHPFNYPMETPDGFDSTFYPPEMEVVPKKAAIVRANRYMVDNSGYLIAYVWHTFGGAGNLLEYARKREARGLLHINNLAASLVCGRYLPRTI